MPFENWGAQRWANHLTQFLNTANPPNRYKFDLSVLAKEFSSNVFPDDPITEVSGDELDGFVGALLPGASRKRWGILYSTEGSAGRQRFTVAHELGHYLLHRNKFPDGFRCTEDAVYARDGNNVEREADEFASGLLMPFDDFRRQIDAKTAASIEGLSDCAKRYEVSLAAAVLRWLRYTERRSMIVVSRDGFVKWAWSSSSALTTGRYIRTRGVPPVELPRACSAAQQVHTEEAKAGIERPAGVWFDEKVRELTVHSDRYDLTYTLLHFDSAAPAYACEEQDLEDTFERFSSQRAKGDRP